LGQRLDISLTHEHKADVAVILFHGMTGSPFEMKAMAKALFKAGYDVFAECLCGHGTSEITIKEVKWTDWREQALRQTRELAKKYKEVYLAGLCMGAALALCTVISERIENVKGIIAISTTLFFDGWAIPKYKFLMPIGLHTIIRYYYTYPESESYGLKNEHIRKKIIGLQKKSTAMDNYPLSCTYELLKLAKYVTKNLEKVDLPILIFHSKEDNLTSTKSAEIVYNNISSKQKEYVELENSYHLVVLDNDKEFVFEKSIEFINDLSEVEEMSLPA